MTPTNRPYRIATAALSLALAFSVGYHAQDWRADAPPSPPPSPALAGPSAVPVSEETVSAAAALEADFQSVAARLRPSVVNVTAVRREATGRGTVLTREGHGSGVVVDARGYVVTNYHVVDLAGATLSLDLPSGERVPARLVATDLGHDLALLQYDVDAVRGRVTPARLGADAQPAVGAWVLAFGSPLDSELAGSVSVGIVSANYRSAEAVNMRGITPAATFLQTDAAVNPGSSGGPLVNLAGEVVGINTGILSKDGGSQGVAFAVPAATVRAFLARVLGSGIPAGDLPVA